MLDKTILVFYIDIGNLAPEDVARYMDRVKASVKFSDEDESKTIKIFIPIRDKSSYVECLNVLNSNIVVSTEEEKEKMVTKIETVNKKIDRIVSVFNARDEKRGVLFEKV